MTPEDRAKLLEDIANDTKKLADPVDFKGLESRGLISKEGAWYRVQDFNTLPFHVKAEVSEVCHDDHGTKVVFKNSPDFDKYARQFRKLGL